VKRGSAFLDSRSAVGATVRRWLVFTACAAVATLLIAALQAVDASRGHLQWALAAAPVGAIGFQLAPTFADAASSLRLGRHAEAYGRFVALADEGDFDAARVALMMHRFGPTLFGSTWDASTEQLELWTQWSEVAARRDLCYLRPTAPRCDHVGALPSASRNGFASPER
jgi:hypothetical protein